MNTSVRTQHIHQRVWPWRHLKFQNVRAELKIGTETNFSRRGVPTSHFDDNPYVYHIWKGEFENHKISDEGVEHT